MAAPGDQGKGKVPKSPNPFGSMGREPDRSDDDEDDIYLALALIFRCSHPDLENRGS